MTARHHHAWLHVALLALAAGLASGSAQALTIENLKGQGLEDIYGTYAPRGDCTREPRISMDDSGFTFRVAGRDVHSGNIEFAVSYGGPDYQGISRWFFPFPVSDDDFGRVLMTVNPDEKRGTLAFESNLGPGQSMSPLQAALVRGSPYAKCGGGATATAGTTALHANAASPAGPRRIYFDKDAVKPTPAQTNAIRRATANDLKRPVHPDQPLYSGY
jgi:hypothetical protein